MLTFDLFSAANLVLTFDHKFLCALQFDAADA